MYNWTDGKAWCYTAYCNSSCGTEIRSQPCNFTPPPTSSIPITSSHTPVTSVTPETQDCFFLNPRRKVFELKYVGEEKNPLLSLLSYLG